MDGSVHIFGTPTVLPDKGFYWLEEVTFDPVHVCSYIQGQCKTACKSCPHVWVTTWTKGATIEAHLNKLGAGNGERRGRWLANVATIREPKEKQWRRFNRR